MYLALAFMCIGILGGYTVRDFISQLWLNRLVFFAILCLLFLLGIEIGCNDRLFAALPSIGLKSIILTIFFMAGSILFARLAARFFFKS